MNTVLAGAASSGKLVILSVKKKAMADGMGFALNPNFHIESDPSNIDFRKVKNHMMLVAKHVTIQFFQRQMMWPKKCLSPQAPGTKSPNTTICLFQR